MRVGVPYTLAVYLVGLDFDGVMVVRSPLAKLIYDEYGVEGLKK
jgi:hypothetical protein